MSLVCFCAGLGTRMSAMQGLARTWETCTITGICKPMWKGNLPNFLVIYTIARFLCCENVTDHLVGFLLGLGNDDSNGLVSTFCRFGFGDSQPIQIFFSKRRLCKLL